MADDINSASGLLDTMDGLGGRARALTAGATGFASAMSRAFNQSVIQGKQLDDVLKGLALRLSNMAVTAAFKPIASGLAGGLDNLFAGLFAGGSGGGNSLKAAMGAIKPFAAGGVIGTPTYFPLTQGGVGLAGEAGPEAILPLARGAGGRLGVAASGRQNPVPALQVSARAPAYGRDWAEASGDEAFARAARPHLIEIGPAQILPGDVLLFRCAPRYPAKHAAIVTAHELMVHAHDGACVAEVAIAPWWRRRLAYAFRFPGVTD